MTGLVLGAMLSGIRAVVLPEARGRIVEQKNEEDIGVDPRGGKVFRRQLGEIQRGKDIDALTVELD